MRKQRKRGMKWVSPVKVASSRLFLWRIQNAPGYPIEKVRSVEGSIVVQTSITQPQAAIRTEIHDIYAKAKKTRHEMGLTSGSQLPCRWLEDLAKVENGGSD